MLRLTCDRFSIKTVSACYSFCFSNLIVKTDNVWLHIQNSLWCKSNDSSATFARPTCTISNEMLWFKTATAKKGCALKALKDKCINDNKTILD